MTYLSAIPLRAYLVLGLFLACTAAAFTMKDRVAGLRQSFLAASSGVAAAAPGASTAVKIETSPELALRLIGRAKDPRDQAMVRDILGVLKTATAQGDPSRRMGAELEISDLNDIIAVSCEIRTERGKDGRLIIRGDISGQVRLKGACWSPGGDGAGTRLDLPLRSSIFSMSPIVDKTIIDELSAGAAGGDVVLGQKRPGRLGIDWNPRLSSLN